MVVDEATTIICWISDSNKFLSVKNESYQRDQGRLHEKRTEGGQSL